VPTGTKSETINLALAYFFSVVIFFWAESWGLFVLDRLLKLGKLKEAGLLTDEEFQKEKKKILNDE
jgi:hypothetical protein